jgi:hypothetical protein
MVTVKNLPERKNLKKDHTVMADSKGNHWVFCPNQDDSTALEKEPQFCPICGEDIK